MNDIDALREVLRSDIKRIVMREDDSESSLHSLALVAFTVSSSHANSSHGPDQLHELVEKGTTTNWVKESFSLEITPSIIGDNNVSVALMGKDLRDILDQVAIRYKREIEAHGGDDNNPSVSMGCAYFNDTLLEVDIAGCGLPYEKVVELLADKLVEIASRESVATL